MEYLKEPRQRVLDTDNVFLIICTGLLKHILSHLSSYIMPAHLPCYFQTHLKTASIFLSNFCAELSNIYIYIFFFP